MNVRERIDGWICVESDRPTDQHTGRQAGWQTDRQTSDA